MERLNREQIIEKAGIVVADKLSEHESMLQEIRDFLKVVRIAQTRGFALRHDPSLDKI